MSEISIDDVISEKDIAGCLSTHLSTEDSKKAACVNKTWRKALHDLGTNKLSITVELLNDVQDKDLKDYIEENHKYTKEVDIYGWSRGTKVPNEIYDELFHSTLKKSAKRLSLKGRGTWATCHCPKEKSKVGAQLDTISDITNLEYLYVATTFTVSSCALLDLVSRSPKLKVLRFYGVISNHHHHEIFKSKRFLCDLEQVYWPFPKKKKQVPTLTTIIKRNENIATLYTSSEVTCDLLSSEALQNLRYLSMNLNENWACEPGKLNRARNHLDKLQYLSLAKNVEALEIRTFEDHESFSECGETNQKVEHLHENYKLAFWAQIAKWSKLKYLAIYGSWELEQTCREMVKHGLQVEYLKINLIPSAIMASIDQGDDVPVLTMPEGARNLRKLSCLRSLHFICYEKLKSIDRKTTAALKELMDLFWVVDIKTGFTEEVEDLLNSLMKRATQLGKMFRVKLYIQPKDPDYAGLSVTTTLRFPLGTPLRAKLLSIADSELAKRNIKGSCENLGIWGLEQVEACRDVDTYSHLKSNWRTYEDKMVMSSSLSLI